MGMMDALVAALRGHKNTDSAPVKADLGKDGMAGRMNGNARDEYNLYVETQMTNGQEPLPYPQWYAQRGKQ